VRELRRLDATVLDVYGVVDIGVGGGGNGRGRLFEFESG
jgi:hypothetical protein